MKYAVLCLSVLLFLCAGPVSVSESIEDIAGSYSERESVWQHLKTYSIYQWEDTTWVPEDPFRFPDAYKLMLAIPDTIKSSAEHFTVYNIVTSGAMSGMRRVGSTHSTYSTVAVDTLSDSTVCIEITGFEYEQTADEFLAMLPAVKPFPYLVIDLRGNPGGYIDQVQPIVDAFLPKNQSYLHVRERIYNQETRTADSLNHFWKTEEGVNSALADKRVSILMDGGSASASEILIVALKERFNAVLVGDTSYGKGIGQIEINRRGRPGMKITCMQFRGLEKIGEYHKTGIAPDVFLGSNVEREAALLAAVKVFEPDVKRLRKGISGLPKSTRSPVEVGERYIEVSE